MGRRAYSLIQRADELKAAKDDYDVWLRKPRNEKQQLYQAKIAQTGNQKNDRGSQDGYVVPFGVDQTKKIYAACKVIAPATGTADATEETQTALLTAIIGAIVGAGKYALTVSPVGAGTVITRVPNLRLARVSVQEKGARVLNMRSRITNLPYSYTVTNSFSTVFGQKVGTDQGYEQAKAEIRAITAINSGNKSVAFTPQGDVQISVL